MFMCVFMVNKKKIMKILYSPMNKKNISKPNSRIDAFNVLPKICKPFECLDNLNIRNTRTKRITRRMAKDIA